MRNRNRIGRTVTAVEMSAAELAAMKSCMEAAAAGIRSFAVAVSRAIGPYKPLFDAAYQAGFRDGRNCGQSSN